MGEMLQLKWLLPGMRIKRWIFMCVLGLLLVGGGPVLIGAAFARDSVQHAWLVIGIAALGSGIGCMIGGMHRMMKSILEVLMPSRHENELVELVYRQRQLERGQKLVAIGGGTGLSMLVAGLKQHTSNITAIVTVADDGGSSGRLRAAFDMPPPGDIRNCLVALAGAEPLMRDLFQYRFEQGEELQGHNFGNLFIAAMMRVTGDFQTAVRASSRILNVRGRVLPSCNQLVQLAAELADGQHVIGETRVGMAGARVQRLTLEPSTCTASPEVLDSIRAADGIILGPGSLYTSILPNLLVAGVTTVIRAARVPVIYVCNVMTQLSETARYTAADHLEAILEHTVPGLVSHVIVNSATVPSSIVARYRAEDAHPVTVDHERLRALGCQVMDAPVMSATDVVRHDPDALAKLIVSIITRSKG